MEFASVQIFAGFALMIIFARSKLPMLATAIRTRDLRSHSIGQIGMSAAGNLISWLYVVSLPMVQTGCSLVPTWNELDTQTIREGALDRKLSSSNSVRRKCPRWFTPNWDSKPSSVLPSGVCMTPALLTRPSSRSWLAVNDSTKRLTEARLPRSSSITSMEPGASARSAAACSPAAMRRQAATTCAPCRASCAAVARPIPELAPVTIYARPPRSFVGALDRTSGLEA